MLAVGAAVLAVLTLAPHARAAGAACPAWVVAATAPPPATTTTAPAVTTPVTTTPNPTPGPGPAGTVAGPRLAALEVATTPQTTLVGPAVARLTAAVDGATGPATIAAEYWQTGAQPSCTQVQTTSQSSVQIELAKLRPATPYTFRFVVRNAGATALSSTGLFTTLPAGEIPQGVTIGTTPVSKLTGTAARTALSRAAAKPVRLTYAGAYLHVPTAKLGLHVGVAASVAAALQAKPGTQLPAPAVKLDGTMLRGYVASLVRRWGRKAAPPTVRLVGTHAVVSAAIKGVTFDKPRLTSELARELNHGTRTLITLPTRTVKATAAKPVKAVVVRLASQTLTAYLNGKPILKTPVTTGRPALPTPIGSFSVQFRASPYVFHSPWPAGSPYYYPPTPVTWAMEFYDGDFLHDDPAEPAGDFGSDSNNGYFASHGCVHVPHDVMAYLYNWLPVGAPVIVAEN
jgi:lipoprotein-anchoring transpeptidase ErfK/SrfK